MRVEKCGQGHSHEKDPNCQDVERLELARQQSAISPQTGLKKGTVISSVTTAWDSRAISVTTPWHALQAADWKAGGFRAGGRHFNYY